MTAPNAIPFEFLYFPVGKLGGGFHLPSAHLRGDDLENVASAAAEVIKIPGRVGSK